MLCCRCTWISIGGFLVAVQDLAFPLYVRGIGGWKKSCLDRRKFLRLAVLNFLSIARTSKSIILIVKTSPNWYLLLVLKLKPCRNVALGLTSDCQGLESFYWQRLISSKKFTMDAQSPNGLTLFDGVELKFYDRKLTPDAIFGFLSRMDDWPRKDVKYDMSCMNFLQAFIW
jgi:hypothetical protein